MKNVVIAADNPSSDVANTILGREVSPPRSRWNVSSLMASVFGNFVVPTVSFASASAVRVFGSVDLATHRWELGSFTTSNADSLLGVFKCLPGNSKSRPLDLLLDPDIGISIPTVIFSETVDPERSLDLYKRVHEVGSPTFTAASLVGRILSVLEDPEVYLAGNPAFKYALVIDQVIGEVRIFDVTSQDALGAFVPANFATSCPNLDLLAAFTLSEIDPAAPDPDVQGPFWG